MKSEGVASVPKRIRQICGAVLAITDAFCHEHLNAEYAELCRRLIGVLGCRRHKVVFAQPVC